MRKKTPKSISDGKKHANLVHIHADFAAEEKQSEVEPAIDREGVMRTF